MRVVHVGPVVGLAAQVALLGALDVSVGLGAAGWLVGLVCAMALDAAVTWGLETAGTGGLGPAGRITMTRASLVCGVAALTAQALVASTSVLALVTLTTVALALDAIDGWTARRTGSVTAFGARFDMEVDAFLILVLSVLVAPSLGWWVLAIGAARYALGVAGAVWPWLAQPVPPRYWRKVVAAVQGVVLAIAASGLVPRPWLLAALVVALALLAESFGRDVWWLWRRRTTVAAAPGVPAGERHPGRVRRVAGRAVTGVAFLLLWVALVAPNEVQRLTPAAFVRIPVEGLLLVALALVVPTLPRRLVAAVFGLVLGVLSIVKVLDMGYYAVLDRPFDPVYDWYYLGPAVGVLRDSVGATGGLVATLAMGLLVVAVLVLTPLAAVRVAGTVAGHRAASVRALAALGFVWVLAAVTGVQTAPGARVASTSEAALAYEQVHLVRTGIADEQAFARALAHDPYRSTPGDRLLTGLRGKDVLLVFVESYGRVAVQDSSFSPGVDRVLDAGTRRLRAAGFGARSAFLTSPTFGAASWLAHSTLQSGLWVDSQRRYDHLMTQQRTTLTDAFGRAGWRTVSDVPANTRPWPEGQRYYGFDQMYDAHNVGYAGPAFSYANMPDQYTLANFRRRELVGADPRPVMAEIDLESSHHPWTPLPRLVGWDRVGDGSVFDGMPEEGPSPEAVFRDPDQVRTAYGRSIEYTMRTLVSFVRTYPDPNLVMVVLGDHQPHTYVSGTGVGHDVPISVIAHDRAVLHGIDSWGWESGLRPRPDAPVWRMDSFRDRFLAAYGPHGSVD